MSHFIQTIRDGMMMKVHNVNPHGRPVLVKILEEVYDAEDAKRLGRSSRLVVDYNKLVKCEYPCFPLADRTLLETKSNIDEFVSDVEDDGDSGLDDGMTLKQLKNRFVKKRKHIHSGESTANGKPVEDESDLNEPLINFKPSRPKISKSKRKHLNRSVISTSTLETTVKSEGVLVSEDSQQAGNELAPTVRLKIEIPDSEQSGCQKETSSDDASFVCHSDEPILGDVALQEFRKMVQREYREPVLCAGKYQDCVINNTIMENLVHREDTIVEEEQPSSCSFDSIESNNLNCEGHIENELLKAEEKHNSTFPITDAESRSSLKNRTCDNAHTISTPELYQPPERLISTRKAISPSFQERLCLAMNDVETVDLEQNIVSECKEGLLEKQTQKKASSPGADIHYDKITVNHRCPADVIQRKFITSPKRIIKKLQTPKGNNEGPCFSRTLSNLSTGCTTIQGFSEGAIAFSQRQMHDMESLSEKLMSELKSMKDIVEQKLLFEAYRNVSLKNDTEEVKLAIDSANKVEEMTRKWLSVLARDCNRFCKIMKLMPNSTNTSCDIVPRENRKIMFADEAGGKLCHVKLFENGSTSPPSDGVKQ